MPSTTANTSIAIPPTLLLGGSGRLGRMLRSFWRGQPVLSQSRSHIDGAIQMDLLRDPDELAAAAKGQSAILCLAGVTRQKAQLSLNTDIALAAIRASSAAGRQPVLLASSAAVYGDGLTLWHENDKTVPVSAYGHEKLRMEQAGIRLGHELQVPVCALRIGNVAGADAILGGWQPGFRLDTLADNSTPLRSYIGPHSFAAVISQILRKAQDLPDILNVCLPQPVRMGDLLDAANRPWTGRPAGESCIASVQMDTTRLSTLYRFQSSNNTARDIVEDWRSYLDMA